jgi:DNA mismatch repair ATPase MutS
MSSINKRDDVASGASFYYNEARRIFDILTANTGGVPLLCLIDELLSGTNSLERVSASIAILKYLTFHKALVVAATHDVKIASLLKNEFRPCHFTDQVGEKGLEFNYKIREGVVETTNAIRLLERIGYPESIIREALELKKEGESVPLV